MANPFGGYNRGWQQVKGALERAASSFKDGEASNFENITKYVTPDIAFIFEIEREKARVNRNPNIASVPIRVTSIFRPENSIWRVVHRHADPLVSVQSLESLMHQWSM